MPFTAPDLTSVAATGRAVAASLGFTGTLATLILKDQSVRPQADWHTGNDEQNRIAYDIVSGHSLEVTMKAEVMTYTNADWPKLAIGTVFDQASFPILTANLARGHALTNDTVFLIRENALDSIKAARPHEISLSVAVRNYPA